MNISFMSEIEKHCSLCRYYWTGHGYMYCTFHKKRITARKKFCKQFEIDNIIKKD